MRLLLRDAQCLYEWDDQWTLDDRGALVTPGTPVLILGTYPFGTPPAWLSPAPVPLPAALPLETPRRLLPSPP